MFQNEAVLQAFDLTDLVLVRLINIIMHIYEYAFENVRLLERNLKLLIQLLSFMKNLISLF